MDEIDYSEFVRRRITELRLAKGVSEYDMSYALGHSKSYIQNIVSGHSLPSMDGFFDICDYLEITPQDFFAAADTPKDNTDNLMQQLSDLNLDELISLLEKLKRLSND